MGYGWTITIQIDNDGVTIVFDLRHYKKCVGAFVVFDLTNRRSFENVRQWIFAVRERAEPNVQIGLIGNKTDSERRAVSRQEGQRIADQ